MHESADENTVKLLTEDDDLHVGVKVTRLKLMQSSAYYRGLASSGMRDAGLLKVTVPDVSKTGLKTVADFIEADDKQTVVPTSLNKLEEVGHNYCTIFCCCCCCLKPCLKHAGTTPGQYNRQRRQDSRDAVLSETVVQ